MRDFLSSDRRFTELCDAIQRAAGVEQAIKIIADHYQITFVTYHLANAVTAGFDAPFVRTNYPDAWVARYLMRDYVKIDPVVREGFRRLLPFSWSKLEFDERAQLLIVDALEHGLSIFGYSVPVIDRIGRRALLSFNGAPAAGHWPGGDAACRAEWQELAHVVHRRAIFELFGAADPAPRLAKREIECLTWAAAGKDYKAIGILLGLSEHTVKNYLKSARFKLQCSTQAQAVSKAIMLRLISP